MKNIFTECKGWWWGLLQLTSFPSTLCSALLPLILPLVLAWGAFKSQASCSCWFSDSLYSECTEIGESRRQQIPSFIDTNLRIIKNASWRHEPFSAAAERGWILTETQLKSMNPWKELWIAFVIKNYVQSSVPGPSMIFRQSTVSHTKISPLISMAGYIQVPKMSVQLNKVCSLCRAPKLKCTLLHCNLCI